MKVLGLSFAHDSGVALVDDGRTVGLIQRERITRRKRCALLTADFIEACLREFGLEWRDVDHVAVATPQAWPYVFVEPSEFSVAFHPPHADLYGFPDAQKALIGPALEALQQRRDETLHRFRSLQLPDDVWNREYICDDLRHLDPQAAVLPNVDWPLVPAWWTRPFGPADLEAWCRRIPALSATRQGYMPLTVTLRGVERPGLTVPHHLAHAANAFYQSDCERATIYTIDNGDSHIWRNGYTGGIYASGEGTRLIPVGPAYDFHGHLYQRAAERLGLGEGGGAGKLMGLAPYGRPEFHDPSLVGNAFAVFGEEYALQGKGRRNRVLDPLDALVERRLAEADYDPSGYCDGYEAGAHGAENLARRDVDIAATVQEMFERNLLRTVTEIEAAMKAAGVAGGTLCLGGGGALNCPANSLLWRERGEEPMFVPPCCDDSGLPLGAAFAVAHDVLGLERRPQSSGEAAGAYLGTAAGRAEVERALRAAGDAVVATPCDPVADAAAAIARGEIVGWYQGRAEIGPRALGHRSLLADPRRPDMWRRVNGAKKREYWRPFAPAVLEGRMADWFDGAPACSPFMLFTARVTGDGLPAITHVDGSARVQTVDPSAGGFHDLLAAFDRLTGVPVVLNTSLNGPGEPIVDTPGQAIRYLAESSADALYFEGLRVERAGPGTAD